MITLILALLTGCLTPETFTREYMLINCEQTDECTGTTNGAEFCTEANLDAVAAAHAECPAWDADAAAACLDALDARECGGSFPPECARDMYCE